MAKHPTPLLDQLEEGPWPSFVSDIRQEIAHRKENPNQVSFQIPADAPEDLLGLLEESYRDRETHWKHGGVVGVFGYGGGVIGRYCDQPEKYPGVAQFHTLRVAQPSGKFYSTSYLRQLCDMWEMRGSGLTNMHGSTGDIVLIGTDTPQLEEVFHDLTHQLKTDLGGSGSNLRTPAACLGRSRCEFACYNTQEVCWHLTQEYQDELHRPAFPYKFKLKFDGCPNGCVAAMARSDLAFVGTWKDDIRMDQEAVRAYIGGEFPPNAGAHASRNWGPFDIEKEVIGRCPTHCMRWDGRNLHIDNKQCVRCMHCINVIPRALRIGTEQGASVLFGAKAPVVHGAQLGSLLLPFIPMEPPYAEVEDLIEKVWNWWADVAKNRERLGETVKRLSLQQLLDATGLPPLPQQIRAPRTNPYMFFRENEVPGGRNRDLKAFRSRHQH
ncbi:MAG: dissimilatory-type sulfite reductase subunit alpha [Desulfovibrionaceae bacterium]|nr:dissimilatory-type sulfite reductase subunit alpha [Desulfovibrionaceae bacterium]